MKAYPYNLLEQRMHSRMHKFQNKKKKSNKTNSMTNLRKYNNANDKYNDKVNNKKDLKNICNFEDEIDYLNFSQININLNKFKLNEEEDDENDVINYKENENTKIIVDNLNILNDENKLLDSQSTICNYYDEQTEKKKEEDIDNRIKKIKVTSKYENKNTLKKDLNKCFINLEVPFIYNKPLVNKNSFKCISERESNRDNVNKTNSYYNIKINQNNTTLNNTNFVHKRSNKMANNLKYASKNNMCTYKKFVSSHKAKSSRIININNNIIINNNNILPKSTKRNKNLIPKYKNIVSNTNTINDTIGGILNSSITNRILSSSTIYADEKKKTKKIDTPDHKNGSLTKNCLRKNKYTTIDMYINNNYNNFSNQANSSMSTFSTKNNIKYPKQNNSNHLKISKTLTENNIIINNNIHHTNITNNKYFITTPITSKLNNKLYINRITSSECTKSSTQKKNKSGSMKTFSNSNKLNCKNKSSSGKLPCRIKDTSGEKKVKQKLLYRMNKVGRIITNYANDKENINSNRHYSLIKY